MQQKGNLDDILVSVIVPVYNVEAFLPQCIDSLLAQTHPNMQIILVDDGSTDGSGNICDRYAAQHSHIKVIHKENGGQASARNMGMAAASGAYIGFVDSDDFIEPQMYRQMLQEMLEQNAQIAACGRYNTDEAGKVLSQTHSLDDVKTYSSSEAVEETLNFGKLDVSCWDKLFARDLLDGIQYPVGEINEDAAIIYKIILKADRVVHIGAPMYYYRTRSNSTTKSGYHPRKMAVMDHAEMNDALILEKYPQLKKACRRYRAFCACDLLCNLLKDSLNRKRYPQDYARCIRQLRQDFWYFISNPNITIPWKLRGTAIAVGLYEPMYKLLKK